jgi:hypothetical protein
MAAAGASASSGRQLIVNPAIVAQLENLEVLTPMARSGLGVDGETFAAAVGAPQGRLMSRFTNAIQTDLTELQVRRCSLSAVW